MNEEFSGNLEQKWKEWKSISAVKRNRLFTLTATTGAAELVRPGPRVVAALKKLVDLFHHTD